MEQIIKERIFGNSSLFNEKELKSIRENFSLIKKIYMLGLIDGKNTYEK